MDKNIKGQEKGKSKPKHKRQHKDTVFVDLFARDETAKQNFMSLYNAIFNTNLDLNTKVELIQLENVLYTNLVTDVSCIVDNKIIFIAEHQSTINENMPLRCLSYISRIYDQLIEARKRYRKKGIRLKKPKFYVFYNGREEYPVEKTLKLSDFYEEDEDDNYEYSLEVKVKVININTEKGNEILQKCKPLMEYSRFVESVRRNRSVDPENGFEKAIDECMENGILSEYLERKSREVRNMLTAEYDYDMDIEVQREEAWELGMERGMQEGIQRGIQKGIKKGKLEGIQQGENKRNSAIVLNMISRGFDIKTISECTDLGIAEIQKIKDNS